MKHITISFDVIDGIPDKELLHHLAISLTLDMYHANTVTITHPLKGTSKTYDLKPYRRDIRRFPQATDEGDAL